MRESTRPILTNGSDVTSGGLSLLARLSYPFSETVKEGLRVLLRSLLHERNPCDVALGNHLKGRFCRQPVLASSGPTITSPLRTAPFSCPTGRAGFCIWQDDYRSNPQNCTPTFRLPACPACLSSWCYALSCLPPKFLWDNEIRTKSTNVGYMMELGSSNGIVHSY